MARITVAGDRDANPKVALTKPNEDGDYGWVCQCGAKNDAVRPIDEAIANAEVHVDFQCRHRHVL